MKRSKILINILIIITSLFLIYKVYSYIDLKRQEKESVDIYKEIEEKVSKMDNKDEDHANGEADEAKEEAKKVDFDALEAINKDIVCWLESDEEVLTTLSLRARTITTTFTELPMARGI